MSFSVLGRLLAIAIVLGLGGGAVAQQFPFDQPFEAERPPDPARGEKLFKSCRQCHAVQPGQVKIGPSLAGVVGRQPGSVPDFGYSQDMIDFGITGGVWDEETLDRFLTRPRGLIVGTKMVFGGFRREDDRADLIAYLASLGG